MAKKTNTTEKLEKVTVKDPEFEFVNSSDYGHDVKFDTKPIGYLHDAMRRFRKNKGSIVAAAIIVILTLFAVIFPLISSPRSQSFCDTNYKCKPARLTYMYNVFNGSKTTDYNEAILINSYSIGVAAEYEYNPITKEEKHATLAEGKKSYFQPVISQGEKYYVQGNNKYKATVDQYLNVGFRYEQISQDKYKELLAWEIDTGLKLFYPLIDTENGMLPDSKKTDANYWYKCDRYGEPFNQYGKAQELSDNLVFVDNYLRDENGLPVYYKKSGGGTSAAEVEYQVRILYYNYYRYKTGEEPNYWFGTDSQGYDLAYRMSTGMRLSFILSICVCVINFLIGAIYGAVEGYYGGTTDLIMERITDILIEVPFIVVATLFQIHLASYVGPFVSLLFAFILTGWIGTAGRVRSQFYRFKNQEYVLAARTLGARDRRIIWKHIFPNTLGTIITSSVLVIPGVIFSESMLSYLGIVTLGGKDATSLGTLLSDASGIWRDYPHLMILPAIVIALLMICFNLFGNGLRDAFNPTLRGADE